MRNLFKGRLLRKKRAVLVLSALVLMAGLLTACYKGEESSYAGQTIYGKVTKINKDSVTINLASRNSGSAGSNASGQTLKVTGHKQTITIADGTKYKKQSADAGQAGGQPPEMNNSSGSATNSSGTSGGSASSNGNQPPAKPDGDTSGSGTDSGTGSGTDSGSGSAKSDSGTGTDPSGNGAGTSGNNGGTDAPGSGNSGDQPPAKPDGDTSGSNSGSGTGGSTGSAVSTGTGNTSNSSSAGSDNAGTSGGNSKDSGNSGNTGGSNASGSANSGSAPGAPGGTSDQTTTIKRKQIKKGSYVAITFDADGKTKTITLLSTGSKSGGTSGNASGGSAQGGGQSGNVSYSAVKNITSAKKISGQTITSTKTDQNAVHVYKKGSATIENSTITRSARTATNGDNASFYGVGSAILGTNGKTFVKNSTIKTTTGGAAGIFSYGSGTVYAADTKITTTKDTSGGIHAAGGGTLYAWNLDVTTSGESSAAIRSDRGGGKMVVNGGTYTSKGNGSPAIYSTADIAVNHATLQAKGSEAVCIEGKNSVSLYDSTLSGSMKENSQNDCTWNVILYQSMSGDSEVGTSKFTMSGGTLKANNGGMFYTTNTSSTFVLKNVSIKYAKKNSFFFKATGNSNQRGWGQSGSNGATTKFTAIDQDMKGDIVWDSISKVDFYMTKGSTLKGAVRDDESNAGSGGKGYCNLYISKDSTWTVTGNSKLTSLYNAGGAILDTSGKTVTIKSTGGKVFVKGTSQYTITVKNYKTSGTEAKLKNAGTVTSWSKYSISKPKQLA